MAIWVKCVKLMGDLPHNPRISMVATSESILIYSKIVRLILKGKKRPINLREKMFQKGDLIMG